MSESEHFNFLQKKVQNKEERLSIPQSSEGQDQLLDSDIQSDAINSQEKVSLNPYHQISKSNITQQLNYSSVIYSNQNSHKNIESGNFTKKQESSSYQNDTQRQPQNSIVQQYTNREGSQTQNSQQYNSKVNGIFQKKLDNFQRDEENLSGTFDLNRKPKNVFDNSKMSYSKYESLRPQQKSESKHDQSLSNFNDKKDFFDNQQVSTNTLGNYKQNPQSNVPRTQSLQQFKFVPKNIVDNKNVSNQQIKEMDYEYNEESEEANLNQYEQEFRYEEVDLEKMYSKKNDKGSEIFTKKSSSGKKNDMIKEIKISREKMKTNRNSVVSNNKQNNNFQQLYLQEKQEKEKMQKIIDDLRQQLQNFESEKKIMVQNYEKIIQKLENLLKLEHQVQKISMQKEKFNVEISYLKDNVSILRDTKSEKPSVITQQKNLNMRNSNNKFQERTSNLPTRKISRQSKKRSFSLNRKDFNFQNQKGDQINKYPMTESIDRLYRQSKAINISDNSVQDSKYKNIQQNFEYGVCNQFYSVKIIFAFLLNQITPKLLH